MRSASRTNLFLLELILVILFFSLCAAVCMGVFASAKKTADHSRNLSAAVLAAESAAASWKAADGDLDACATYLGAVRAGGALLTKDFDADWRQEGPSVFRLTLTADGCMAAICVADLSGAEIYGLTVRIPGGAAA